MGVEESYNIWAEQYDTNINKTRDLEAFALRDILSGVSVENCLEIGCGTGKNTEWLLTKARRLLAADLSDEMLNKARRKVNSPNVEFIRADVTSDWSFAKDKYDLVTFSLILEHIEDLDHIFNAVSDVASPGAFVYIGELHPFKQYVGSKARFETDDGVHVVSTFTHNTSDFILAATKNGFELKVLREYFDDNDKTNIPRILALLFQKGND